MDKRKRNKKQDINVHAFNIVQEATEENPSKNPIKDSSNKNPYAVALKKLTKSKKRSILEKQ